ncbi:MAG: sensor histidine kinase [Vicinamibacteraceae bacterium]
MNEHHEPRSWGVGRRVLLAVAVWAGATIVFSVMLYASYLAAGKSITWVLWINAVRCATWGLTVPLLMRYVRRYPLNQGSWLRQITRLLAVAAAVSLIVSIVQMSIVYWTYFPYRDTVPTLGTAIGHGYINFVGEFLLGVGLLMALQAWHVLNDFRAERTRALQLERELAVSRLDALRTQLHPHFLFNSLHTIAGLIGEEPSTARRMVIALGDLLRLTLQDAPRGVRSLAEELAFIDLYMDVIKFRLGDRLVLAYEIEPDATRAEVPTLLFQPLFENAVRHGASRVAGRCEIRFHAWCTNGQLCARLENDGPIKPPGDGALARGVGLTNTLERLRLRYGQEFSFQYTDRPSGGARVELSLPYHATAIEGASDADGVPRSDTAG